MLMEINALRSGNPAWRAGEAFWKIALASALRVLPEAPRVNRMRSGQENPSPDTAHTEVAWWEIALGRTHCQANESGPTTWMMTGAECERSGRLRIRRYTPS